ncbi:MAG: serine protein kinase RIO [Candidatus Thorarchaeota archaeon]|nr:MAG: serine protein kinase RIO [Candidatus Thorarchaeota archaeon]
MKRAEEQHERYQSELDRRKTKRRKDVDDFKVVEGVIDPPTMKVLYKLLSRGTLSKLHGAISTGKEANVYRGIDADGNSVAVKIYRVSTAETDFMLEYITGDPRFKRVKRQNRSLVPQWAMKEFKNLKRYHEAGIRVPKPIDIERNVMTMEFIGDNEQALAAPLLKNVEIPDPVKTFDKIIGMIQKGYTKAGLVHADLSEYNILWSGGPIFIDVSQAVLIGHDNAKKYLFRDIQNIINFFKKLDVETETPEVIARYIVAAGEK